MTKAMTSVNTPHMTVSIFFIVCMTVAFLQYNNLKINKDSDNKSAYIPLMTNK